MALTVNKLRVTPLQGCIVRTGIAAEAVSAGQSVTVDTNGKWVKADADAANKWRGLGVVLNANKSDGNTSGDYAAGDEISIACFGPIAGIDGMDPLLSIWTSTTAGGMTQTKPSGGGVFAASIGYAFAADVMWVAPQPSESTY